MYVHTLDVIVRDDLIIIVMNTTALCGWTHQGSPTVKHCHWAQAALNLDLLDISGFWAVAGIRGLPHRMVQSGFALKGYLLQGKELHCSGGLWLCLLDMHLDNELTTIHQFKYFQDFLNHAGSSENEKLSLDSRRDSTYSRGHFYFGAFWAYLFENSSHYVPSCIFNLCDLKSKLFMVWRFLSLTGCSFVWSKLFRG